MVKNKISTILTKMTEVVSKDKFRPALNSLSLSKGKAIATDGFGLLICESDDLNDIEVDALVQADSIKLADKGNLVSIKHNEAGEVVLVMENGEIKPNKIEVEFPPIADVLKPVLDRQNKAQIVVNVANLRNMLEVISKIDPSGVVTISINEPLEPILIKGKDCTALVSATRSN